MSSTSSSQPVRKYRRVLHQATRSTIQCSSDKVSIPCETKDQNGFAKCANGPIVFCLSNIFHNLSQILLLPVRFHEDNEIIERIMTNVRSLQRILKEINQGKNDNRNEYQYCVIKQSAESMMELIRQLHGTLLLFLDALVNNKLQTVQKYCSERTTDESNGVMIPKRLVHCILNCLLDIYQCHISDPVVATPESFRQEEEANDTRTDIRESAILLKQDDWNEIFDRHVLLFLRFTRFSSDDYGSPERTVESDICNCYPIREDLPESDVSMVTNGKKRNPRQDKSLDCLLNVSILILYKLASVATNSKLSKCNQRCFIMGILNTARDFDFRKFNVPLKNKEQNNSQPESATCLPTTLLSKLAENQQLYLSSYARAAFSTLALKIKSSSLMLADLPVSIPNESNREYELFTVLCTLRACQEEQKGYNNTEEFDSTLERLLSVALDDKHKFSQSDDQKEIAMECLLLLSQAVSTHRQLDNIACHIRTSLSNAFVSLFINNNDNYALKVMSIHGLHRCMYKIHIIDNRVSKDKERNHQQQQQQPSQQQQYPCKQMTQAGYLCKQYELLCKDEVTTKKMISSLLEVIRYGLQRLGQIDEFLRFTNAIIAATKILLDLIHYLVRKELFYTKIRPPSNDKVKYQKCSYALPQDDLIMIILHILESAYISQHFRVGTKILQQAVQKLCRILTDITSNSAKSLTHTTVSEILSTLAKVLMNRSFLPGNLRVKILETIHQKIEDSDLHLSTTSIEWSHIIGFHWGIIEAIARESAISHNDNSIDRRRRKLAATILLSLTKRVCNQKALANHPNVLSSMVRFAKFYNQSEDIEDEYNEPNSGLQDISPNRLNFRNEIKHQIICLANLL